MTTKNNYQNVIDNFKRLISLLTQVAASDVLNSPFLSAGHYFQFRAVCLIFSFLTLDVYNNIPLKRVVKPQITCTYHLVIITNEIITSFILLQEIKYSVHVFMSEF